MDKKTILELVRKVKKLADRGVGGEAEAAKIKLQRLYEKYNLTDDDFVELQESYNRYFILRHQHDKKLLSNLICMILETPSFGCGESKNILRIKLTDDQYNDILASYEYYQRIFDDYSKYLMQAIISRNAIGFIPKPNSNSQPPPEEPVPEIPKVENSNKNTEPEFDMIKLMKIAVAIESNPWKKISNDKNLLDAKGTDTVDQTNHVKTRDNFSST